VKLSLILVALGLKLWLSARFDAAFRKQLLDVDRLIVIRTRDGRCAQSYRFRDDKVTVSLGVHPEATAELVWSDASIAVAAMLSSDELDLFSAIGRGDLTILGNLQDALWFSDIAS
jgi:hypothetical protein